MTTERISLDEATAAQLRDFAALAFGVEVRGNEGREVMIGKLREVGFAGETIPVHVASAGNYSDADRGGDGRRVNTKVEGGRTYVHISLHTQDKIGGDQPVPVGVNGRIMLIPRGKACWVPEEYVEVLEHSEEFVYSEYTEGLGGLQAPRKVPSYPFSYV